MNEASNHRTAMITGVTGQDGRYLAAFLLERGYRVVGLTRDPLSASKLLVREVESNLELLQCSIVNDADLKRIVQEVQPHEIYNLAALSSGAKMFENPEEMLKVNAGVVLSLLEAIRLCSPSSKLFQASSREVFGLPQESPQDESSCRRPRSPYGAAKLYADNLIEIYRATHGVFCCSGLLFNHESPYRREEFVSRKVTRAAARISLGIESELVLGSLESVRDWAHAADFVEGFWLALQQDAPQDFVFATGVPHSVRDLCEIAFASVGLNYLDYCRHDPKLERVEEETLLVGNFSRAEACLGWKPKISFKETVEAMVQNDLTIARELDNGC